MSPIIVTKAEPAYRKWTPAVERGVKYLLAVAEFDAKNGPITLSDGTPADPAIKNEDIAAAGDWLRHRASPYLGKEEA